ncbi:MAG: selenocysteine-specific translation elongation factor [Chloroflexi bacterium RBG_13_48_10]|nr:MAG: selenocysteine-specific translation elongation factor [Chloroflexi bacterium RBG_13_48_10]
MHVIGTAGHVDHGKSTLVQALTGTHPDRLKEEREREMTIDLGFAWLTLPSGEEVGIVDVPGHRDFVENMLAGIGGIDAALFVIAADEGMMPQTTEHLAILDLLQVQGGVIVLTKIDLISDPDWLDLVEEDISSSVKNTVLQNAPIVRVSSRTHQGIPELLRSLDDCLQNRPPRPDLGRPRLPVDRVFTMAGFGTVVTGTLSDGSLHTGDDVVILPSGLHTRIRGLQTHHRKEDTAIPGSRTAINLTGINIEQVKRGDVIAYPGSYQPSQRIDVRFRLLPDVIQPLKHDTQVKIFHGAAEILSRVRLLGSNELMPGEEGWLQLELKEPLITIRGDRYILRRPSPGETLGGGIVVDPHPKRRHKRFSNEELASLETLARGTPAEIFFQALNALSIASLQDVTVRANLDINDSNNAARELIELGQVIALENDTRDAISPLTLLTSKAYWDQINHQILQIMDDYHKNHPLRRGISREELKSRLKFSSRFYNAILRMIVSAGALEEHGSLIQRVGHSIRFNPQQQRAADGLLARFIASPFSPPTSKECLAEVGEDIYTALLDLGLIIYIPPDVVFRKQDYELMLSEVISLLKSRGTITAAEVRDHFNTSRRYVLALLEYLDTQGITVREGDIRRLK